MSSLVEQRTPVSAATLPKEAVLRLTQHLRTFVQTSHEAATGGSSDPVQAARWSRASSLLARELQAVEIAAQSAVSGSHVPLIAHASRLRFLAKSMDGYRLDFAGPVFAQRLLLERRLIVLVAWQIHAFASGSKASGL